MIDKLTRQEIKDCTHEIIDRIQKMPDRPKPEDITAMVRKQLNKKIQLNNSVTGQKITGYIRIPPRAITELILAFHHFIWTNLAGHQVGTKDDIFLVYHENGPKKGIYTDDRQTMSDIILTYEDLNDNDENEVLKYLKTAADRKQLNTNPDLIAVKNGIYQHSTKQLLPFTPDIIFTTKIQTNYNPDATDVEITEPDGTLWRASEFFESLSDDKQVQQSLKEGVTACVRHHMRWNHAFLFLATKGNNGKGTYIQMIRNLCGQDMCISIPLMDFGKQFALERLIGVQNILTDENDVGGYLDQCANLKATITGDILSITRKHKTNVLLSFPGFMIQCLNDKPKIKDKSGSWYRRIIILPFKKSFEGKEKKYIKQDYLTRQDVLEYYLKQALESDITELSIPDISKQILNDYQEYNDPLLQFWSDLKNTFKWDLLPFTFLYDLYKAWMMKNTPGGKPLSLATFKEEIVERIEDDAEWECKGIRQSIRSTNRMDQYEPLIIEYQLENFMVAEYKGNNPEKKCDFLRSQAYYGLIRKSEKATPAKIVSPNNNIPPNNSICQHQYPDGIPFQENCER